MIARALVAASAILAYAAVIIIGAVAVYALLCAVIPTRG